jgi:hypothetical protein
MNCTRCGGTGFLNYEQVPKEAAESIPDTLEWLYNTATPNDVSVCDCCGNGDSWYGEPGEHYNTADPRGNEGPYAYNGGLCECN